MVKALTADAKRNYSAILQVISTLFFFFFVLINNTPEVNIGVPDGSVFSRSLTILPIC